MIIVEGLDGVGKTSLINKFVKDGFSKNHFDYDVNNLDLVSKYLNVLNKNTNQLILDRSFISEVVYGPVLRNFSKIDLINFRKLLQAYSKEKTTLIYLNASKNTLLDRRKDDSSDYSIIESHYDELSSQYDLIVSICREYLNVLCFSTDKLGENELYDKVRKLV